MRGHALTFDLEDWHQVCYQRMTGNRKECGKNFIPDTYHILEILDKHSVHATFFVVGCLARSFPEVVKEIALQGHEIGCHTYHHQLFTSMTAEEFRNDILKTRKLLQDISGQPVYAFRAPEFTIGDLSKTQFFDILFEAGFKYDSSVFPVEGVRYGIPEASRSPFNVNTSGGIIREYPLATWRAFNKNLPIAGGTYFRVFPLLMLRHALRILESDGHTGVFYFHPYEFHHGILYLDDLNLLFKKEYIKYLFLHNIFTFLICRRLTGLLNLYIFCSLQEIYSHEQLAQQQGSTAF